MELPALELYSYRLIMGKMFSPFFGVFDQIHFVLAGNEDIH